MKTVTITEFRKNIFQLVDEAVANGGTIAFDRKGVRVVVRGESKSVAAAGEREERWAKFWAQPPRAGSRDFTVEEFNRWSASSWEWREEP